MDRSNEITLVAESYAVDAIGQRVPAETERTVFCNVQSVTRAEWTAAGEMGLNASAVVTMFAYDYHGEKIAVLNGERLAVYRTYKKRRDEIELMLGTRTGVKNG